MIKKTLGEIAQIGIMTVALVAMVNLLTGCSLAPVAEGLETASETLTTVEKGLRPIADESKRAFFARHPLPAELFKDGVVPAVEELSDNLEHPVYWVAMEDGEWTDADPLEIMRVEKPELYNIIASAIEVPEPRPTLRPKKSSREKDPSSRWESWETILPENASPEEPEQEETLDSEAVERSLGLINRPSGSARVGHDLDWLEQALEIMEQKQEPAVENPDLGGEDF